MAEQPTIIIVDDDPGIREALGSLIRSVGVEAKALASVPEFLNEGRPDGPTCLVLDVRLPGRSGLDFQRELAAANIHVPIIFITGYGDIPMSVQAIKGGAIEFLTKPFRDQDLLDAIQLGWRMIARGWRTKRRSPRCGSASRRSPPASVR